SQEPEQAADSVQAEISKALAAYRFPARRSAADYGASQALGSVYAQRANAPLWSHDGRASAQAQAVVRELRRADTYGLEQADYAVADAGSSGRFDVQLSAAALR